MAWPGVTASSSPNTACLISMRSGTASITKSTSPKPSYSTVPWMRPTISSSWRSASSWVIFSFATSPPSWAWLTSRALARPWSTNSCLTSLRTTGTPVEATTWAISPPMVPAPTTAALKTNTAGEAIGGGRGRGASCLRGSMCPQDRTVEEELARIASAAHGVVTRSELLRTGITADEIRWRVRTGSLLRQHRGVYRVGHRAPSIEARYLAAVLAGGEGALLSGLAAAHLLGLVKGTAPAPEVMALTERRIDGVRTHRSRAFDARDATIVSGIPVTTVP